MALTGIEKKKIRIRANAMRIAHQLAYADLSSIRTHEIIGKDRRYKSRNMGSVAPLSEWPEIDCDTLFADDDYFLLMDRGSKAPAVWPIHAAMALPYEGGIGLSMARSIPMKDMRGWATVFSPYMMHGATLRLDKYNRLVAWGEGIFSRVGGNWVPSRPSKHIGGGGSEARGWLGNSLHEGLATSLLVGLALRQRYEWSAVFSFPTGIRLRFGCSARGALELFRDREKGDLEQRRSALLHWVRRHWRRQSTALEVAEVRKHLRGVSSIEWRGMEVTIYPAEFDIEQAFQEAACPAA